MGRTNNIQKLIQENPVNKGLDYAFIGALLCSHAERYFPGHTAFKVIDYEKHKRRVSKHSSSFIYTYTLGALNQDKKRVKKYLVYSAHSDGSRIAAFTILTALIRAGFNTDEYRVMVPLEYIADLKALIYEQVPGNTLLHYIQKRRSTKDLLPLIKRTARWLHKFHYFMLPDEGRAKVPVFHLSNMNWTVEELQRYVDAADAHQGEKLKNLFTTLDIVEKKLRTSFKPGLTYGDLHPENIITDNLLSTGLTMIDFTDVAMGDSLRDIGSFIQQLEFMARSSMSMIKIRNLRRSFIETYFGQPMDDLPQHIYNRINLYQAWNAFRGFVYFFFNEKTRIQSYGLLEDSFRYLYRADHDMRTFTIEYKS